MSLFSRRSLTGNVGWFLNPGWPGATAADLIRRSAHGWPSVNRETAMRNSAVWACLRLRANLVSSFPVDAYRIVDGRQVEVPKWPILVNPGGERVGIDEWLYSSQMDLDRSGNVFGLIRETNGFGLPSRIDLVPCSDVSVLCKNRELTGYRVYGEEYAVNRVWHERQYTLPGLHVGLSPVAFAAWSLGEYQSIQEFALDWFSNGTIPSAHLRNTQKTLKDEQADAVKARFKASVSSGDPFVTGADWEYNMLAAEGAAGNWIEAKRYGIGDIARFFDCPGDLIDAAVSTGSITYANITQRNLQFLIMHLGPAVTRRENALTKLLPAPRRVRLNTDALLRMDPQARANTLKTQVDSRTIAPSEVRELEDRPPFTEEQLAEFDRLFGAKQPPALKATQGSPA